MTYYINYFSDVETTFHSWDKFYLIILYIWIRFAYSLLIVPDIFVFFNFFGGIQLIYFE